MHVDMDAFFASVEQRDHPELRGKPVVVGGSPSDRGVVAAASYEARRYGVRSAMPMLQALRLCPQAIRRPTNMAAYREASRLIHILFEEITTEIEPISLDEAYLDISRQACDYNHAEAIARNLKSAILRETQLTASVGIGSNKFLAKIASDHRKPDGLFVVQPHEALSFLEPLSVRAVPGVGPKTEQRLLMMDIRTVGQLRVQPLEDLCEFLGAKHGERLHHLSHGLDDSPVRVSRRRKSLSQERTFSHDIGDPDTLKLILRELAEDVATQLGKRELSGRVIGVKVRYADFRLATRSMTLEAQTQDPVVIARAAELLLDRVPLNDRKVRLLGVRASDRKSVV